MNFKIILKQNIKYAIFFCGLQYLPKSKHCLQQYVLTIMQFMLLMMMSTILYKAQHVILQGVQFGRWPASPF